MKKGYGAPTTSTIGEVGEKYLDLTTGEVYECTNVTPTERDMGFVSTYELYNAQFTWVKATGGGVTHWDDLEGKPFGEEVTVNTLIEEQSITCTSAMSNGYPYWVINPATFELVAGQEYRVVWDGVEYTCLAEVAKYDEGVGLGNLAKIDAAFSNQVDNGLPFGIYHQTNGSWNRIVVTAGSPTYSDTVTATISIRITETTITTIDPKFLPEPLQFGEEVVETPFIEAENLVEDATVVEGEYFDVGTQVRVYCSGTSFGELTVDTAVEEDGIHVVDPDKNLSVLIDVAVPGSWGVSYGEGSNRIDGILRVSTISKEVTPLDPKYIVLTSPNGTKYTLSVADDGTLSAVPTT